LLVTAGLLPGLWIARNYTVAGIGKLTTIDTQNLVYYVGGGAYELRLGVPFNEARNHIAAEYHIPTYGVAHNTPWSAPGGIRGTERALRNAAPDVLLKYPKELLQAQSLGVMSSLFGHDAGILASHRGVRWKSSGVLGLFRGNRNAWKTLLSNHPSMLAVFSFQMLHTFIGLTSAIWGVIYVMTNKELRSQSLFVLGVTCYFLLAMSLAGYHGTARFRVPVMPFVYVFSGVGITVAARLRRSPFGFNRV